MTLNKSSSSHSNPRRLFLVQKLVLAFISASIVGGLGYYSIWVSGKREPPASTGEPQLIPVELRKPLSGFNAPGKPTSLHLWANYCAPCLLEIPNLMTWVELWESSTHNAVFVNVDTDPEQIRAAIAFTRQYPVNRFSFNSGQKIFSEMKSAAIPRHLITDNAGKIAVDHEGSIENNKAAWITLLRLVAQESDF